MVQTKFVILVKSASIDTSSNLLSLGQVIEELQSISIPATLFESTLVALFERDTKKDPAKIDAELVVVLNDKKIAGAVFVIDFQEGSRNRTLTTIELLTLSEYGILSFQFFINKKPAGKYELQVKKDNSKLSPKLISMQKKGAKLTK